MKQKNKRSMPEGLKSHDSIKYIIRCKLPNTRTTPFGGYTASTVPGTIIVLEQHMATRQHLYQGGDALLVRDVDVRPVFH